MSLWIEVDDIQAVLLTDGWHVVKDNSFDLDCYEMHHGKVPLLLGGATAGICGTGAVWTESDGAQVYCPLTSILAVRTKAPPASQQARGRAKVRRVTPNA